MGTEVTNPNYPQVLVIGQRLGVVGVSCHPAADTSVANDQVLYPDRLAQGLRELGISCRAIDTGCPQRGLRLAESEELVAIESLGNVERWADPGKVTAVITGHEDARQLPCWRDPVELLRLWAGPGSGAVTEDNPISEGEIYQRVRYWREAALERLRGRKLRVYAASERALLGMNSVNAIRPDGTAETDPGVVARLPRLNALSRALTQVAEAENLLQSPRIPGLGAQPHSGCGWGLAMLAAGLRGSVEPLWPAVMRSQQLDEHHPTQLVIFLTTQLHPQTILDSIVPTAAEYAAIHAAPVIGFCHEASLSRHEMAQWGLHGIYQVPAEQAFSKAMNVLAGTWLPMWRKRK